eukprot:scaffold649130_cov48-Prasinocladus_malaysianus.AAC.1
MVRAKQQLRLDCTHQWASVIRSRVAKDVVTAAHGSCVCWAAGIREGNHISPRSSSAANGDRPKPSD